MKTNDNKQKEMKEHLKDLCKLQEKIAKIAADKEAAIFTESLKEKEQP
jgi:hypothetical protein